MRRTGGAGMVAMIAILTGCVSMDPSVVDPESYLGSRPNAPDVYRSGVPPVLLPIMDVRIDPMDRLFLVNFDDDPIYEGVELQTFPAAEGGPPEARVLLWRPDTVDVYDSPERTCDEEADRRGLEALLSPREVTLQRTDFNYRFGITEHGLDAAVRIRDREGRLVEVEVVETRGEPVVGGLIAPVGATSASPDYLPLFFLDEFALVKRDGTRIRITAGLGPGPDRAQASSSEAATPSASGARVEDRGALYDPVVLEAFLDGLVQGQLRERSIAGATVAVVGGGEVLFTKGYGYADVNARRPVDSGETLFRIASVTKLFTFTAVMQLAEEGLLDLDADVNEYLDFRIPDTYPEPVTLTHLMTHTAGFEEDLRNLFTFDPVRLGSLEDWVKDNLPHRVQPPGTFSVYSNYGTALAGYIVERTSGLPWEDYIERRILDPLGMERTTGREPLPEALAPHVSQGYEPRRGGFEAQPFELNPGGAPAGSMSSTAADMATFMLAFLGGGAVGDARILEEGTVARMLDRHFAHDPRLPGNGLGFFEMSSHGVRILGHGGNTQWFHNTLALFPEHDLGLFVSFNTTTAAPLTYGPFLATFLHRFFPDPPAPPTARATPTDLAPYAGHYRFNRMSYNTFQKAMGLVMTMRVRAEGDVLVVDSPLGPMRLVQVEPLFFREELGHTEVVFRTDDGGPPTHAFVSLVPMMGAERVPWHGAPPLHFAILGGGLLVFLGVLVWAPVGWFRRWRRRVEGDRTEVMARRALLVAAAAHVGFFVVVAVMAAPDLFAFLSTPMTGFAMALVLPVLGTLAAVVAGWALMMQWRRGAGTAWARLWTSGLVALALLFAWSLHYWNLLGWRL